MQNSTKKNKSQNNKKNAKLRKKKKYADDIVTYYALIVTYVTFLLHEFYRNDFCFQTTIPHEKCILIVHTDITTHLTKSSLQSPCQLC